MSRTVRPGDRVLVSCISPCGRCRYCREQHVRAVPGRRGLDPRPPDRRHPGRVRPRPLRRPLRPPAARRREQQRRRAAGRHLPHRLRGGRAQRTGPARRHRRRGRRRARSGSPRSPPPGCSRPSGSSPWTWPRPGWTPPSELGADAVANARRGPRAAGRATSPRGSGPTWSSRRSAYRRPSRLCTRMVRPGGHVANVGVHGKPATLHLEDLWIKNVTITTGLVDTYSTPTLLRMLAAGRLPAARAGHPHVPAGRHGGGVRRLRHAPPTPARSRSYSARSSTTRWSPSSDTIRCSSDARGGRAPAAPRPTWRIRRVRRTHGGATGVRAGPLYPGPFPADRGPDGPCPDGPGTAQRGAWAWGVRSSTAVPVP